MVGKDVTFHQDDVVIEETENVTSPNLIENSKTEKYNSEVLISSIKKNRNLKEEFDNQKISNIKNQVSTLRKFKKLRKSFAYGQPVEEELNLVGLASLVFLLSMFLSILSIPMAIIAIRQFKKNPGKYKGIWLPITTLMLSVLTVALIVGTFIFVGWTAGPVGAAIAVTAIITLIAMAAIIYLSLY
jgi:hypothetical protein